MHHRTSSLARVGASLRALTPGVQVAHRPSPSPLARSATARIGLIAPADQREAKRKIPPHRRGGEPSLTSQPGHLLRREPSQDCPARSLPKQAALRDLSEEWDRETGKPVAFNIAGEEGAGRQCPPRSEDGHGLVRREVVEEHGGKDVIKAARAKRQLQGVTPDNLDLGEGLARGRRVPDHVGILIDGDDAEVEAGPPRPRHQGARGVRPSAAHVQHSEVITSVWCQQLPHGVQEALGAPKVAVSEGEMIQGQGDLLRGAAKAMREASRFEARRALKKVERFHARIWPLPLLFNHY